MTLPFKIIGVSHKTASILSREYFDSQVLKFTEYLRCKDGSRVEYVEISTCNRSEILFSETDLTNGFSDNELLSFFDDVEGVYLKKGREAIKHFFGVCAGLDSLVLGEAEIFGQVKRAYSDSIQRGTVGPVLHRLFQESFRVAKKLRSNTSIGRGSLSVASLAVHQAVRIFGSLNDRKALVIGAGETGTLVARILRQQNIDKLFISNRTYEKAIKLSEELDGIPLPFNKFEALIGIVDIVVVAVGIRGAIPLINKVELGEKCPNSDYSPLCILDLSVPRQVNKEIESLESVYTFCVDDLRPLVNENLELRKVEALRAEHIIADEIDFVVKWFCNRGEASLIAQVGESILDDRSLLTNLKLSDSEFRMIIKKSLNSFFVKLRGVSMDSGTKETSQGLIKEEILENLRLNANR